LANKKQLPAIKYTSRDFDSIKQDLVDYARRYYPNTFKDFNEAGFGSLMLDTVSYVGDILSFYLDYNVNESFIDTAVEYNNVLKLGKQMGFRLQGNPTSYGIATFYIIVPANASGLGPDQRYIPILKRNSSFTSQNGNGFLLNQDITFTDPLLDVVVARVNQTTGVPTHYAIRSHGQVISGRRSQEIIEVGDFQRFLRIQLDTPNVSEVISILDEEGNEFYGVDFLSQDVIFRSVTNRSSDNDVTPSLLKPFAVPRRFIVERDEATTFIQFGAGSDTSTLSDPYIDPSTVILDVHGRNYVTQPSFDPSNMLGTDKLGISPSNTKLSITLRTNEVGNVNAMSDTLTQVDNAILVFEDEVNLDANLVSDVINSVEINNDEPIVGDVTIPTTQDLKIRMFDTFASQNRAVTAQDYKSIAYAMPSNFGAIKRINIIQDPDSFKRNLNMYIISEDMNGNLTTANSSIKNNLKNWINQSRMINDTVDILDAKIVNIGIDFIAKGEVETNRFLILDRATQALRDKFGTQKMDIGEPFYITEIYKTLQQVPGLVDVLSVKITQKTGSSYSDTYFDIEGETSADERYINVPLNCVLEIKIPSQDIKGAIK
jgi:hypothetical protein|tara:strand:- start:2711 stop:4513 length:1803 start_codon:yes stop_codon:yes gene_type:complete